MIQCEGQTKTTQKFPFTAIPMANRKSFLMTMITQMVQTLNAKRCLKRGTKMAKKINTCTHTQVSTDVTMWRENWIHNNLRPFGLSEASPQYHSSVGSLEYKQTHISRSQYTTVISHFRNSMVCKAIHYDRVHSSWINWLEVNNALRRSKADPRQNHNTLELA